jgi:hypothetical protein
MRITSVTHSFPLLVFLSGVDMAYSDNQNQLSLWGRYFLGDSFDGMVSPEASLRFWCAVHKRVARLGRAMGPDRFLLLNFDELCSQPELGLKKLIDFLGVPATLADSANLRALIKPSGIGRHKEFGTSRFDKDDLAFAAELGF